MDIKQKIIELDSWIKTQPFEIVEEPEINPDVPIPYLKSQTPAFLYTINCDENYAFLPMSYNETSKVEELGYIPVKLGYENSNGPILSASGDLRIYLIIKKDEKVNITYHYFLIKIMEYLDNYFDDVSVSNNDILIGRKKVLGGAMIEFNGMLVVVFQINFVNKEEDIKKLCPYLKKKPGYIDSSVVSAEQLKDEFLSWLR